MSEKVSILDKFHKIIEQLEDEFETDNSIALFAVEMNSDGFPVSRVKKIQGSAANTMAAFQLIQSSLDDEIEKWHQKIEAVGDISDKINEVIQKITGKLPKSEEEIEDLLDKMKEEKPELYENLKDIIKAAKGKFGS